MRIPALVAALSLVAGLLSPAQPAAGAPSLFTARIANPVDGAVIDVVTTDREGAFLFEEVPAGWFRLEVSDAAETLQSAVPFYVPIESAPARFRGRVAANGGGDVLLRVDGHVSAMADADIRMATGYPHVPRKWDLAWRDEAGWLVVTIHGGGKENISGVSLFSAEDALRAEYLELDVPGREVRAHFRKADVFAALVPPAAHRWDTLDIQIGVTTAAGTQLFSRTIRLVGGR